MFKKICFLLIFLSVSFVLAKDFKTIAKIPEASGIDYSIDSNSLFVANDEGSIYEINPKGKILRKKKIGKYDFEAVVVDDQKNILLLINEKKDKLIIIDKKTLKVKKEIKIKRKYDGISILKKGGDGIEGLAVYNGKIYASNQSDKKYPAEDSSVIVVLDYDLDKEKLKIKDIINHGYEDIAGLTFYKGDLFMVSDDKNLLIRYDIKKNKTIKTYKLPKKYNQEGISFDKKDRLFIADDKGKVIRVKYENL